MKAIIVGDCHVGRSQSIGKPGIGNLLNSRLQDQIHLLDWILEQAINNNVFTLFLTGDVFDVNTPSPIVYSLFFDWLKRCEISNVDVYIIMGNHEIVKSSGNQIISALDVVERANLPNVHVFKTVTTVHFDNVSFTLIPYRDRRTTNCSDTDEAVMLLKNQIDYELAEIPLDHLKVVVGHLTLDKSLPIGDEQRDSANVELICKAELFNNYNYVWMGHIHKPQVLQEKPCRIAHVGSTDLSDFGESGGQKIIVLLDTNNSEIFKEIILPTRNLYKVQVHVPLQENDTTDYIIKFLSEYNSKIPLKDAIVKLEVKLPSKETQSSNRDVIIDYVYNTLFVHYISNFSESKAVSVVPLNKQTTADNTMSINSAIKLWADHYPFQDEELKQDFLIETQEVLKIFEENNKENKT